MNTKKSHLVSIGGPAIPLVPVSDFNKLPHAMLKSAWWIIGPSVSRNIEKCAIWEVIAAAYLEGMNHGYGMAGMNQPQEEREVYYGA